MRRVLSIAILLLSMLNLTKAQRNEVLSPHIQTLQVTAGDNWLVPPVVELHGDIPIVISFDDMTHTYHRYAYKIEHCEADWTTSDDLFTSDYAEGMTEGNTIDNITESDGMNSEYTHYALEIPNEHVSLRMSGNYRVTIYDDNSDENILIVCFLVVEPLMTISMSVTTNTDVDVNKQHQQVEMTLGYGSLPVSNHTEQIHTVLLQNWRWDNCKTNTKPTYIRPDGLTWTHSRDHIFDSGNEYRKFEMTDVDHATMGIEHTDWDGNQYHAWLWTDEPRTSYSYDEDANGNYYIRNFYNDANEYTSEYVVVHFTLKTPRQRGEIYVNGRWTNGELSGKYRMTYDDMEQTYKLSLPLKQGYYSYQYVLVQPDGKSCPVASEGNFYQTENSYQTLVYYREIGGRTDRLVGYGRISR